MNLKNDFPIFKAQDKSFVYLDNASTTQKPKVVIDAVSNFYAKNNANVHRGIYKLSEQASSAYENARLTIAKFINAQEDECIFVKNATEGLNLVANGLADKLCEGDEILLSAFEHHANLVPWQKIAQAKKCKIKIIPKTVDNDLDYSQITNLITPKTKVLAITHMSNVTGTIIDIKKIRSFLNENIIMVVDGSQAIAHSKVDVKSLGVDYYVFTGHKLYAPMGVAVIYAKQEQLQKISPLLFGGNMIHEVTYESYTLAPSPQKFEAGTPAVAEAVGLATAIDYINNLGHEKINKHIKDLTKYLYDKLAKTKAEVITSPNSTSIASFYFDRAHAHDVATILDSSNVAVRAGHHCAMPLVNSFNVAALTRCSLGIYNDEEDIDALVKGLNKVIKIFKL